MFREPASVKGILIGFFGYMVTSVVAMAIVVQHWIPPGITDRNELLRLAETDPSLLWWQSVLGAVLGVLAGFVACHFSGGRGLRTPLVLGILFIIYGVVGIIYFHPTHPVSMQVGKVLSPIPLVLLGGWLRIRLQLPPRHSATS